MGPTEFDAGWGPRGVSGSQTTPQNVKLNYDKRSIAYAPLGPHFPTPFSLYLILYYSLIKGFFRLLDLPFL